jgi:hypothetical protein
MPSLVAGALELLYPGKNCHFAGVLEDKEHWKFLVGFDGLGETQGFNAHPIAAQHELGVRWDSQAVDFMALIVHYDKSRREVGRHA